MSIIFLEIIWPIPVSGMKHMFAFEPRAYVSSVEFILFVCISTASNPVYIAGIQVTSQGRLWYCIRDEMDENSICSVNSVFKTQLSDLLKKYYHISSYNPHSRLIISRNVLA